MSLDPRRIKALFHAALDLPDPAGRPAFLDRECRDDRELRRRLEELLAAHDRPASALERPLAGDPGETTPPDGGPGQSAARAGQPAATGDETEAVPDQTASLRPESPPPAWPIDAVIAGRYQIRQEIGEGGMGSVYLAEQLQPVRRRVALKLIKAGMDSKTVLARFESERQALALMDHPNIATVLDAGTTEGGRPSVVMELVKGIPLTDCCDQHRLGLPGRLDLFRQVCSAVQHAHQRGIIHRDLKPSNILVEGHDGRPVPKVIDFGLAKATTGLQLTEQSHTSAFGAVVGTPLYMAPEQASFNAIDVDTRADVYALGVILYELLTGSTPIRKDTFRRVALDEMLRLIREVEPPTPSSRIGSSDAPASIAAARQSEPSRLGRFVRGDLDWIVMKALAKDRRRRYESPIALSQDIERFLNHEPVSAGPPSAAYRLRKFVRRHRPQVVAASLVLLALVVGIVGTTLGLIEARRQSRRAEQRLAQIEKANAILGSIFKDLNPKTAEKDGKPLSALLGERLDQATAQIEGEAIGDPLAVARMQQTLGESQLGLGYPVKAVGLLTKALATFTARLGPDDPVTLHNMITLASGYRAAGELDRALPLHEEARVRARARLGPDHPVTLAILNSLAIGYGAAGEFDRALPLDEEVFALAKAVLGPDHPETLVSMRNLALGYEAAGKFDRSIPLFQELLKLRRAYTGADRPETWEALGRLGVNYKDAGRLAEAMPLLEEATRACREHPTLWWAAAHLSDGYLRAGQADEAIAVAREQLEEARTALPADSPLLAVLMVQEGDSLLKAKAWSEAEPILREALAIREAKEPDAFTTFSTKSMLGGALLGQKRYNDAEPLLRAGYGGLKLRAERIPPRHRRRLAEALDRLIELAEATDKPDEAMSWRDERAKLPGAPATTPEVTLK